MKETADLLENSLLIVAHPDDECLWFSSVMGKVGAIIVCYEDHPTMARMGERRRAALADHPLAHLRSLSLVEPDVFASNDWQRLEGTRYGLALTSKAATQRYVDNFHLLRRKLLDLVQGCSNVITHNPWGEYGHPDHAQVYRVLESLRAETGFDLWYSNYCSVECVPEFAGHVSGFRPSYVTLQTDRTLSRTVEQHYRHHHCWTWYEDFEWFDHESFAQPPAAPDRSAGYGSSIPLNLIVVDFVPGRPSLSGRVKRKLRAIMAP